MALRLCGQQLKGFSCPLCFTTPRDKGTKNTWSKASCSSWIRGALTRCSSWQIDHIQKTTVSCWQQKHVDVCQIVCNLFALPSARNWVSYDDHVGPSCCAMQWREWYSKRGGVPRTVFADVSDSEDEIVQDAVSNMSLSAIRRATQVITGLNPGSHQIFVITRASGGYALARQLQSRCESWCRSSGPPALIWFCGTSWGCVTFWDTENSLSLLLPATHVAWHGFVTILVHACRILH